ncbi:MAG: Fe-S cluster assembly ATPase SufC [Clostridiales bacterium]|nr:Fe-S cluster assembly ATPase SufC [Clostridiales bacterium]
MNDSTLLTIRDLKVNVADKEILHGLNMTVDAGQTHVIMGPNGAGKSTLGNAIAGAPKYEITAGSITFKGEDITELSPDKRAKAGIYLSFQNPVEVPGITLANFIRTCVEQKTGQRLRIWNFKKDLQATMELLGMDPSYADRDLNVGFSGGEKKKAEILQLLMLKPELAILDETDSGLDIDAVRTVSRGIEHYRKEVGGSLIIITHITRILDGLTVDKTHILSDGRIIAEGGRELVDNVNDKGFDQFINK